MSHRGKFVSMPRALVFLNAPATDAPAQKGTPEQRRCCARASAGAHCQCARARHRSAHRHLVRGALDRRNRADLPASWRSRAVVGSQPRLPDAGQRVARHQRALTRRERRAGPVCANVTRACSRPAAEKLRSCASKQSTPARYSHHPSLTRTAKVGGGTLHHFDSERKIVEIGYFVLPHARRRGIATTIARLLSEHAFSLGVERVAAYVNVGKVASEGVVERAGFTREGVVRSVPKPDGRRIDKTLFSLLPGE